MEGTNKIKQTKKDMETRRINARKKEKKIICNRLSGNNFDNDSINNNIHNFINNTPKIKL